MRRAVPQLRGNIRKVLDELEVENTQSLLLKNLGISLSDHYWIKPVDRDIEWESINSYENRIYENQQKMPYTEYKLVHYESFISVCMLMGLEGAYVRQFLEY